MENHHFLLFPADLAIPLIILANSMPSGGPGPRGTPKSWKFGENGGIPQNSCHFGEFHQKKHPKLRFWWKSTPKRIFTAQDPSKYIGKALVSLVFALRGCQSTISTPRSWKWCKMTPFPRNVVEFLPFSPKRGDFGEIQPRAEIPSPEPY